MYVFLWERDSVPLFWQAFIYLQTQSVQRMLLHALLDFIGNRSSSVHFLEWKLILERLRSSITLIVFIIKILTSHVPPLV